MAGGLPPAAAPGALPDGRRSAPLLALTCVVLAGASFVALACSVKAVAPEVGLAPAILARGLFGVVAIAGWAAWRGVSLRPRGQGLLLLRCTTGGAAMLCYYRAVGLEGTDLATAAMLLKTSPLWVALLAPWIVRERPGARVWLALAVGLVGVALVGGGVPRGDRFGMGLGLASGLLSAFAYLALRGLARTDSPTTVVALFSAFLVATSAPFVLARAGEVPGWSARVWGLLALAGLFGTAGQLFVTSAYRFGSAAAVTIAGLTEVAMAMVASRLLFEQMPPPAAALGGLLAMGAGLLATSRVGARSDRTEGADGAGQPLRGSARGPSED